MKVSRTPLSIEKRCVYINDTTYETWYAKPVSLGLITNRSGYWYTADQMRFVSSRDALEYLIRIYEHANGKLIESLPEAEKRAIKIEIEKAKEEQKKATVSILRGKTSPSKPTEDEKLFKEFLEFKASRGRAAASNETRRK